MCAGDLGPKGMFRMADSTKFGEKRFKNILLLFSRFVLFIVKLIKMILAQKFLTDSKHSRPFNMALFSLGWLAPCSPCCSLIQTLPWPIWIGDSVLAEPLPLMCTSIPGHKECCHTKILRFFFLFPHDTFKPGCVAAPQIQLPLPVFQCQQQLLQKINSYLHNLYFLNLPVCFKNHRVLEKCYSSSSCCIDNFMMILPSSCCCRTANQPFICILSESVNFELWCSLD